MELVARGKKGIYHVRYWIAGKEHWRSTGLSTRELAEPAARKIVRSAKAGRLDALEGIKLKQTVPTLQQIVDIYDAGATFVRPRTRVDNAWALTYMVRLVHGKKLSEVRTTILTRDFVKAFQDAMLKRAGGDMQKRDSAEVSANSIYRQARSVFGKRKAIHLYDGLGSFDVSGFTDAPMNKEGKTKNFVPFPPKQWKALQKEMEKIKDTRPKVRRAFLMMSRLGMGNSEVIAARGEWLEPKSRGGGGYMVIKTRPYFRPKTKNRFRRIGIAPDLWKELKPCMKEPDRSIIGTNAIRVVDGQLSAIVRRFFPGRTKSAYELRKHAGSIVATRDGILTAAKFLGDTVATAEAYYVALLKEIRPI